MRQHYDSGRLTLDEFEDQLAEVNTTRTRGDLGAALSGSCRAPARRLSIRLRDRRSTSSALQYLLINLVCILVWAFSGAQFHDFSPKSDCSGRCSCTSVASGTRSSRRRLPPGGGT